MQVSILSVQRTTGDEFLTPIGIYTDDAVAIEKGNEWIKAVGAVYNGWYWERPGSVNKNIWALLITRMDVDDNTLIDSLIATIQHAASTG